MKFDSYRIALLYPILILLGSCQNQDLPKSAKVWEDNIDPILLDAITSNDTIVVDSLISTGVTLNTQDRNGATPLLYAAMHSDSTMYKYLEKQGAKPPSDGGGFAVFQYLAVDGFMTDWYGDELTASVSNRNTEILEYLINQGYDINQSPNHPTQDSLSGWTPLMHAIYIKNIPSVLKLLDLGADHNAGAYNQNINIFRDTTLLGFVKRNDQKGLFFYKRLYEDYNKLELTLNTWDFKLANNLIDSISIVTNTFLNDTEDIEADIILFKLRLFLRQGLYLEGISLYEESETAINKANKHIKGLIWNDAGILYKKQGIYEKSKVSYNKALANALELYGKSSAEYGTRAGNFAEVYSAIEDYKNALPLSLTSLKVTALNYGTTHNDYAVRLNNLAALYSRIGDYERAAVLQKQSIDIAIKNSQKYSISYIIRNLNLTNTHFKVDQYEESLTSMLAVTTVADSILPKEHPHWILINSFLGRSYKNLKRYDLAEQYYSQSYKASLKKFGKQHIRTHAVMSNLGQIYLENKNIDKAIETYKSLVDLISKNENHKNTYTSLFLSLAEALSIKDDKIEIEQHFLTAIDMITHQAIHEIPFLPMNSQLNNINDIQQYSDRINSFYLDKEIPESLYLFNLIFRGLTIKNAQYIDTKSYKYNQWQQLKSKISKEQSKPISSRNPDLAQWIRTAESLYFQLDSDERINHPNSTISITEKNFTNLVIRHRYFNPSLSDSIYYSVIIRNNDGKLESKFLFEESELKDCMSNNCETSISDYCNQLIYERLIDPIIKLSDNTMTYKISPAGLLHKINLAAIKNPETNNYLFEESNVEIHTVTQLNETNDNYKNKDYLLVGGVDYGKAANDNESAESNLITEELLTMRSGVTDTWDYLPFSKSEVESIEGQLENQSWNGQTLTGDIPTEERIKEELSKDDSPRIVHFATHGFFMKDGEEYDYLKLFDNPMTRSGLILARANDSWTNQGEEGILTALEIQNLNLRNTELVVLSACDSGLGDVIGSEGVFGLQRAFKVAGADKIIMSVCEISDEVTSEFMIHFYEKYLSEKLSIQEAFQSTQSFIKSKYPDPAIWAAYILLE